MAAKKNRKFLIDGVEYEFKPKKEYFAHMQKAIRTGRRNPVLVANDAIKAAEDEKSPLSEAVQKTLITQAMRDAVRDSVSQEDVEAYLQSMDGMVDMLQLIVCETRPDFTKEDAWRAVEANFNVPDAE